MHSTQRSSRECDLDVRLVDDFAGDRPCVAEMKPVLLLMLMLASVNGEMFTALIDVEQLLHAEHQVALHLRQFVDEQTQHLRQLQLYVYNSQ